jgi:hypothetical protein
LLNIGVLYFRCASLGFFETILRAGDELTGGATAHMQMAHFSHGLRGQRDQCEQQRDHRAAICFSLRNSISHLVNRGINHQPSRKTSGVAHHGRCNALHHIKPVLVDHRIGTKPRNMQATVMNLANPSPRRGGSRPANPSGCLIRAFS